MKSPDNGVGGYYPGLVMKKAPSRKEKELFYSQNSS